MGSRQTSRTRKSPHKKENSATRAPARKITLHQGEEGRSTGVSLGTKNKQTHSPFCVVLKTYHSSTCSHKRMLETPISSNVKQLPNLQTGTRAPNLVEHLSLSGSTTSTLSDWPSMSEIASSFTVLDPATDIVLSRASLCPTHRRLPRGYD